MIGELDMRSSSRKWWKQLRIVKIFVGVVLLLMILQLFLNLLFSRSNDSLFFVNGTNYFKDINLPSLDSQLHWASSRFSWISGTKASGESSLKRSISHTGHDVYYNVPTKTLHKKIHTQTINKNKITKKKGSRLNENKSNIKNSSVPLIKLINVPSSNVPISDILSTKQSKVLLSKELPLCPPVPPHLVGTIKVVNKVPPLNKQEELHPELDPGGKFRPSNCRAHNKVAVIIPYRDRDEHLAIFMHHIHVILQHQQIDYAIFIIEQAGKGKFNRAMLMNVGSLEALKQYPYDCFVFHDVDLVPEDDRNLYTCPQQPRHMSLAIDSMGYKLPYNDIFGGVSAMTVGQFEKVNGFSNKFWGWGGEDDDMSNRIKFHGYFISRYPANIARYSMLSHQKEKPNPRRYQYLYDGKRRFNIDGLNSAKYRVLDIQLRRLYTWIYVDLFPS